MLVVDRVELGVLDQVAHVRHFDDRDAVVGEQRRDPAHESVGVGDVGQHVVAVQDLRADAGFAQLFGQILGEERVPGRDAP